VPPPAKQARTDTGGWDSATVINVTTTDNNNINRANDLSQLKVGDVVRLEQFQDNTRWATFTMTDVATDKAGYFALPVTPLAQGGTIPNSGTQIAASATPLTPPDAAPTPNPGYMSMMIQMQPSITEDIVHDLQEYLCDYLFTVTHLVNYVSLSANVGGVIITDAEEIYPVSQGDAIQPPPV
jgi:hypothetical protein